MFFLKLSATEDSIENVSRNKLRCANFLAGRFTILVGALSTRLLFSMVMAPISGATPPLLFFSFCLLSLSLRSLAGRIFFCTFSHSFFLAHSQGKNLFLHFLSLRSLAERILFCIFSHSFFLANSQGKIFFCTLCLSAYSQEMSFSALFSHSLS